MSFDLIFLDLTADENAPLAPEKAAAIGQVMQSYGGPAEPDEFGYFFDSPKAGNVEFYAGVRNGGMLALRGWGRGTADFVFDILRQTNWILLMADDGRTVFIAARALSVHERERLAGGEYEFLLVASGEDILHAAEPFFGAWAGYRDRVVKG